MERAPWLLIPVAVALVLRMLRLDWQPLWWDEGYSVYFGSEPPSRMLWLTAHDIHPPLYYALLHSWSLLTDALNPAVLRIASVVPGVIAVALLGWLGRMLFPARGRVALIAALLLAISPMHIFYSQEVRMYALAATLCLLASGLLWRAVARLEARLPAARWLAGWAVAAALALYTLYYAALLIAAQGVWALWRVRRTRRAQVSVSAAATGTVLLYLPWLLYALPNLVNYVAQKVASDQDRPLGPLEYLWRHQRAFTVGHVDGGLAWDVAAVLAAIALAMLLALFAMRKTAARASDGGQPDHAAPIAALALWLLPTVAAAFVVSLRLPFFPEGGERLLLIVLPLFLLLVAALVERAGVIGSVLGVVLAAAALLGCGVYFTVPRYAAEDYRPLIRQMVRQGAPGDTMLATFPWMIGYWRAYAPAGLNGPNPQLLGDFAVEYGPGAEAAMERALASGTLWFPEPLGFGSDLPPRMEQYLREHAANVENRWQSSTTRLSAWARLEPPEQHPLEAGFGDLKLATAGVTPAGEAGNEPLAVALTWQGGFDVSTRAVTLRLLDGDGRIWAARDYAPPGTFAAPGSATEVVGLVVPPGVPPGSYTLALGIGAGTGDRLLTSDAATLAGGTLLAIGPVQIALPTQPPDLARLALEAVSDPSGSDLRIVGVRLPAAPVLAGTQIELDLYAVAPQRARSELRLFVRMVDVEGNQGEYGPEAAGEKEVLVTQWDVGWPLPDYPPQSWAAGYPIRLPLRLDTAAWERPGVFRLEARWLALAGGWSDPVPLGNVKIERRRTVVSAANLAGRLEPAPLFGTHARLLGYALARVGDTLHLRLEWSVQQSLLPAHNIFVHVEDSSGNLVTQQDGPPLTDAGPAPTGSWLEGENLVTEHQLTLPAGVQGTIQVGLYEPLSLVRLPVTVNDTPAGDSVRLPLDQ